MDGGDKVTSSRGDDNTILKPGSAPKCKMKSLLVIVTVSMSVMVLTSLQYVSPKDTIRAFINKTDALLSSSSSSLSSWSSNLTRPTLSPPNTLGSKSQFQLDKAMLVDNSRLFKQPVVNCANMLKGVKHAVKLGVQIAKDNKKQEIKMLNNEFYINATQNCQRFKTSRGYITSSLTKEERDFPIAYSLITYKDIEMVERLLRSIYRPQNFYCIHADLKANKKFFEAAAAISDCFPNVFLSSKRISVQWGTFSVLEPELVCMKDAFSRGSWRYFINLTGQEMPLKTNLELVRILTAYNGANDMESTVKRANKERWKVMPPPAGMRPLKGSVHIVANRQYVDFILHNKTAAKLLEWVKKTDIPDETFFTMLNHNPHLGIPGTFAGWPETDKSNRKPFLARFKNWGIHPFKFPCAGYWTRGICILSTGDLPLLGTRRELFANKFHLYEDRVVIGCLEEALHNRTRDHFLGVTSFNSTSYQGLGFVLNQVGKNNTGKFVHVPKYL